MRQETLKIRQIFQNASEFPAWLDIRELELLQTRFTIPSRQSYEENDMRGRGELLAKSLLDMVPAGHKPPQDFLELSCNDGYVSVCLKRHGKNPIASDINTKNFVDETRREGVHFQQVDAMNIPFADASFDFVFAIDGMPHIPDPDKALREIIRVTRPEGYIYLYLASHYLAAYALHAAKSITVPYCHLLFRQETLETFTQNHGLRPISFDYINHWHLQAFRELWDLYNDQLIKLHYEEIQQITHQDLIAMYPSCFKAREKGVLFDDLLVSASKVLFQKKRQPLEIPGTPD